MRNLKCKGQRKDTGEWIEGYYVYETITNILNEIVSLHTIRVPHKEGFTEDLIVLPETVEPLEAKDEPSQSKTND